MGVGEVSRVMSRVKGPHGELPPGHTCRKVTVAGHPGGEQAQQWGIAIEAAVEIAVNGSPFAVMMATPADLEDLAVGLLFSERIVDPEGIEAVSVSQFLEGVSIDVTARAESVDTSRRRKRMLEGLTGCGLCGIESLADIPRPSTARPRPPKVSHEAIAAAFDELRHHQPLNQTTLSVHAAGWCNLDGRVLLAREDVGRHNALDKLIGARLRGQRTDEPGFIVMSSRCSFELVYKAVAAQAAVLATISSPTSLALDAAASLELPIACSAKGGGVCLFEPG